MRVLICGDRFWNSWSMVKSRMLLLSQSDVVVHGAARGADSIAASLANGMGLAVESFPAEWDKYGKAAGPIRNRAMLDTAPDLVIAFHNNIESSRGTKDCVFEARRRGIPTEVISDPDWRIK